ncbi:MAG TPA: SIMPL domain-containing protein [Candidatus Acidoferrum sp.]|nr:SIMPL domain-containing protein [Candidatus Acidoferrum sp.]
MLAGLFLAAGLVGSALLATAAWVKVKNSQFITVKGSVQKNVEADLAIWSGSFLVEAEALPGAQHKMQAHRTLVEKFLRDAGVTDFAFAPIGIEELKASQKSADGWVQQRTTGYRLTQCVSVKSAEVDRLDKLDTTPLVEQGVIFTVAPPQFIYTRAGETKIEMLAAATQDARARAEQIATQGGRAIARLHDAGQGIFQITPQHQTRTSWEGENDTTSRQKTITAVVTATFLLK